MATSSIPMFLITGSLGAGKTTFLNHLLNLDVFSGKRICLIINEFGELGIDGKLVEAGERPMYEINKGSLFCVCVKTDFIRTLKEISDEIQPELLVVEATGMAEPRDIQDFIDVPELQEEFHIMANLCVIDSPNFIRIAPMLRAARQQATWADGLLLNKIDLIDDKELQQLKAVLADMNPPAPVEATSFGKVSSDFIQDLQHQIRRADPLTEAPDPVMAMSFQHDRPVNEQRFLDAIKGLGENLLRVKGNVDFGNGPEFVELVGDRFTRSNHKSMGKTSSSTAFIAIGWRIRTEPFRQAFEAAWM